MSTLSFFCNVQEVVFELLDEVTGLGPIGVFIPSLVLQTGLVRRSFGVWGEDGDRETSAATSDSIRPADQNPDASTYSFPTFAFPTSPLRSNVRG